MFRPILASPSSSGTGRRPSRSDSGATVPGACLKGVRISAVAVQCRTETLSLVLTSSFLSSAQELLNVSVFGHQVFSDEDLARLTVSVLVELLVQVVSNPNLSLSHSNKRRRDPDAADDESPTTPSDPKDVLSHQPFDVLLMRAAKEIGEHVRDEYGRRTMGSPMAATASAEQAQTPRVKRRRSAPRPGSSQQVAETKDLVYSMEDVVQVGGDLLYLSQDVNVCLPTSESFVPPSCQTTRLFQTETDSFQLLDTAGPANLGPKPTSRPRRRAAASVNALPSFATTRSCSLLPASWMTFALVIVICQ